MRYPLVNVYITNWKDPPCSMGKSTISMAIFNSYVSLPEGSFANHHPLNYCRPWKSPIRISDSLPTPCRIYVNLSENRVHQNTIVCYQLSDPNCHFLGQQRYFYLCLTAQMKNLTKKQPARCLWSTPCQALRGKLPWTKEQRPLWGERKTTVRWRYCWGETYAISMDWFKEKNTGNSHISWENPLIIVSQQYDSQYDYLTITLMGSWSISRWAISVIDTGLGKYPKCSHHLTK